ncbi:MAG: hypothetical protein ACREJM_10485 [Candidatus Saccharimonadales bacterium]
MPIHDWTRVEAGIFHHFHVEWMGALARALNQGLLPPNTRPRHDLWSSGIRAIIESSPFWKSSPPATKAAAGDLKRLS